MRSVGLCGEFLRLWWSSAHLWTAVSGRWGVAFLKRMAPGLPDVGEVGRERQRRQETKCLQKRRKETS